MPGRISEPHQTAKCPSCGKDLILVNWTTGINLKNKPYWRHKHPRSSCGADLNHIAIGISPAIQRIIDEVKAEEVFHGYNRTYHRHNR